MRYILDPEDHIFFLGGQEKQIEIDSTTRMLFFCLSDVQSAGFVRQVRVDRQVLGAFWFSAKDALLQRTYEVVVPECHIDYVNFKDHFQTLLPKLCLQAPKETLPPECDGAGHHFA